MGIKLLVKVATKGGAGSGNYGHTGRPGMVGGSGGSAGGVTSQAFDWKSPDFKSPPDTFKAGRFKSKLGADITVQRKGAALAVSVGGRKPLMYRRRGDDYIRQGQRVLILDNKIKFEDV